MKLKNAQLVLDDYGVQKSKHVVDYGDYDIIESYFGSAQEKFSDVFDIQICNNEGKKAANRLVEFVSGLIFSPSGNWIRFKPKNEENLEDIILADKMKQDIKDKLKLSNFYHENSKTISEAFKWKYGFLDVRYNNGVSFLNHQTKELILSVEKGNNQRAYLETEMTARDILSSYKVDNPAVSLDRPDDYFKVLTAILPNNDEWFEQKQPSDNKWVEVLILVESVKQLEPKKASARHIGYRGFPFLEYRPHTTDSLCREVIKDAAFLNYYCIMERDRVEIVVNPPYQGPYTPYLEDTLSIAPNDYIATNSADKDVKPVTTLTGGDKELSETIARLTAKIQEVFKVHEIRQLEAFSGTQLEYHRFVATFYKSLFPLVASLSTSYVINLLERTRALCMSYDKEFKEKYSGLEGSFVDSGFSAMIEEAEMLAKVGMLGQALAPFAQQKPGVLEALDDTKLGILTLKNLNLHQAMKSPSKMAADIEEKAKQVKQQEAMGQMNTASEIDLNQAKAQQALTTNNQGEE